MAIGTRLTKESVEALRRLAIRKPAVTSTPIFETLVDLEPDVDVACQGTPEKLDAIYAVLFFLKQLPYDRPDNCDNLLDHLISSIHKRKKAEPSQIVDLVYECLVCVTLGRTVPGLSFPPEFADGEPDVLYTLTYQYDNTTVRLHVECKNISSNPNDLKKLVKKVIDKVDESYGQVKKRDNADEWIVFVDLPLSLAQDDENWIKDYIRIAFNVIEHFSAVDANWFDAGRILYTTTFERGMEELLARHSEPICGLLPPVVVGDYISMKPNRMKLLCTLFTKPGEGVNWLNFGNSAIRVDNPDEWRL